MKNLNFVINVTAGKTIKGVGPANFFEGGFADGPRFDEYYKAGKVTSPGVFNTLDDLVHTIRFALDEEMEGITDREKFELSLTYTSDMKERGETASYGSYSYRSLNETEMETLIRKVDNLVRQVAYKSQEGTQ